MSILYAGTSLADMNSAPNAVVNTTASHLAPYVLEGFEVDNDDYGRTPDFAAQTDFWFTSYVFFGNYDDNPVFLFKDTDDNTLFDIVAASTGNPFAWSARAYNGASMDVLATGAVELTEETLYRVDVHITVHDSTGVFDVYVDGVLYLTFSGDTNRFASSGVTYIKLQPNYAAAGGDTTFSAIILADEDTRTMEFAQSKPTGAGSNSGFDGGAGNIDENGYNDADKIVGDANGEVSTFTKTSLPAALNTGYDVAAMVVSARGLQSGGGDAKAAFHVNSSTYEGGSFGFGKTFGPGQAIQANNPDTSSAWTFSEADGAEVGAKLVIT